MSERIIRRTRAVARGVLRQENNHIKDIDERMQSIARIRQEMLAAAQQISELEKEVEELMKKGKLEEHQYLDLLAHFVETKTNASTFVDPKVLYAKLKDKNDFFSVVKVQVGELKSVMTEKEIEAVAKITPGKVTGTKFEIIVPKDKAGRGKAK